TARWVSILRRTARLWLGPPLVEPPPTGNVAPLSHHLRRLHGTRISRRASRVAWSNGGSRRDNNRPRRDRRSPWCAWRRTDAEFWSKPGHAGLADQPATAEPRRSSRPARFADL